jgi:hypothetical protein
VKDLRVRLKKPWRRERGSFEFLIRVLGAAALELAIW